MLSENQRKVLTNLMNDISFKSDYNQKTIDYVTEEVKKVLYLDESEKKSVGKFRLYDFCGKMKFAFARPQLCGVYHENGMKIATDGMILTAIAEDYDPELEAKIIEKDGTEITGCRFPKWKTAIPLNSGTPVCLSDGKVHECVAKGKANKKMDKNFKTGGMIGGFFYPYELLQLFDRFCKAYPDAEISQFEDSKLFAKSGENICLLMGGIVVNNSDDRHKFINIENK